MSHPATPDQAPARTAGAWVPWLMAMVFFSLAVAMAAGILTSVSGADLPDAVLTGGAAFLGTMGMCLATVSAIKTLQKLT